MVEESIDQQLMIAEILRALEMAPTSPGQNQRQSKRFAFEIPLGIILIDVPQMPRLKVYTRNLSTGGLGLLSRRPFRNGERVVLHLYAKRQPPRLVLATVTFCRYLRHTYHEVGLQFHKSTQPGDVRMPPAWILPETIKPLGR